jgi:hypothetical protein
MWIIFSGVFSGVFGILWSVGGFWRGLDFRQIVGVFEPNPSESLLTTQKSSSKRDLIIFFKCCIRGAHLKILPPNQSQIHQKIHKKVHRNHNSISAPIINLIVSNSKKKLPIKLKIKINYRLNMNEHKGILRLWLFYTNFCFYYQNQHFLALFFRTKIIFNDFWFLSWNFFFGLGGPIDVLGILLKFSAIQISNE